ncbi:MAG TPA: hypothetical protein K8V00_09200 [Ligilactobacillus acidipiscis]|uniref:Uncharacterized protein n=1 Tax=Ligilactobacillus acidipiscis TaxID=89059 RepID=A0A921FB78_9LACO|nr:hypothetical protein [Ligilactobacillus acidipiscis]
MSKQELRLKKRIHKLELGANITAMIAIIFTLLIMWIPQQKQKPIPDFTANGHSYWITITPGAGPYPSEIPKKQLKNGVDPRPFKNLLKKTVAIGLPIINIVLNIWKFILEDDLLELETKSYRQKSKT